MVEGKKQGHCQNFCRIQRFLVVVFRLMCNFQSILLNDSDYRVVPVYGGMNFLSFV